MDDDSLRLERQFPFLPFFFVIVALVLAAMGVAQQNPDWFIGAALPLMLAIGLWVIRPTDTVLYFGPDSVRDELHEHQIPYDEIQGLSISGKTPALQEKKIRGGRLIISTEGRNHEYPNLNPATVRRAYQILLDRVPESGSRDIVDDLQNRLNNDLQLFDDDLVLSYRARPAIPMSQREVRSFLLAMILGGIIWLIVGFLRDSNWIAAGIVTISIAVFCWVVVWLSRHNENKQVPYRHLASLIISPRGIAMNQGQLKGELKWGEVKAISCGRAVSGTFVTHHPARAITIKVAGAEILIHDVYDRPLATIYRCMMKYWEAQ